MFRKMQHHTLRKKSNSLQVRQFIHLDRPLQSISVLGFLFDNYPSYLEKSRYITGIRNVQHPTTNTAIVPTGLSYADLVLDLLGFLSAAGTKLLSSSSEESEISEFSCIRASSSNSFSRSSSFTWASFSLSDDGSISATPSSPFWFS